MVRASLSLSLSLSLSFSLSPSLSLTVECSAAYVSLFLPLSHSGLGYGKFAKTVQGKTEYKLPAMFLLLPNQWLLQAGESTSERESVRENLIANQHFLVTPYGECRAML